MTHPTHSGVKVLESVLHTVAADSSPAVARRFAELAAEFLRVSAAGEGPVTSDESAEALYQLVDGPVPETGAELDVILEEVRQSVMEQAIRLGHPMFLGHQVSAPLPLAVWSEVLISVMNNSLAVREMSPSGTAVETRLIRWMCELAGLPAGSGGTMTAGGTEATFTAMLAARAAARPDAWQQGVGANPPVIVCGEHAHYAVTRAAGELGLGMNHVVQVPSREFRMDTDALVRSLDQAERDGRSVMAVVATAGSTATGSFDDLDRIGTLCQERGLWFHVDGAHGASALLSERRRSLVRGLGLASSIAWDPHKMMLMPLSVGMLLVRDERQLALAFSQRAPYLFHEQAGQRGWDQGPRSFACSRRFEALKVWIALKRHGLRGLGALYDHLCDLAVLLAERLQTSGRFVALHQPDCNILCFRWTGGDVGDDAALDEFHRRLRERYNASGEGWITTTVLNGRQVLRVTIMNPRTTAVHLDRLVTGLVRTGELLLTDAERSRA